METSSARLPSVAGKPATLFVALELSRRYDDGERRIDSVARRRRR
jgi:hypothetical protein